MESNQNTVGEQILPDYKYFNFEKAQKEFNKVVKDWDTRVTDQAEIRRNMRTVQVDVEALQAEGKMKADETLIPIRVIDANIKQEQPQFITYVKQSRRLAVFKCLDNKDVDEKQKILVEQNFTDALCYNGWEKWVYRLIDGGALHGYCCAEVLLDTTKPGHVNIVAHQHEDVIFPMKAKDLESQPFILVRITTTLNKLTDTADLFGFDPELIDTIKTRFEDKDAGEEIKIYKAFIKYQGVVYVAWVVLDYENASKWLKAPTKYSLGRAKETQQMVQQMDPMTQTPVMVPQTIWQPIDEILYPIKLFKYQETEDQRIVETKGRAWLDAPNQEAQTALYSSFVNGAIRSSNVFCSPKTSQGRSPQKLDLVLEHGCVYNEPLDFYSPPQPNFDLIKAAQALDTRKQMETGQIATAAMSRQDSRKLAKELELAQQTSDQLSTVQITNFAITLTEIFTHAWAIIQSRALQGKIRFCYTGQESIGAAGEKIYVNDNALVGLEYQLRPAGDQDVIRRQEKISIRQGLIPIIQQVVAIVGAAPLAAGFMVAFAKDLIYEALPEDGDKYSAMLDQMLMQQQQMMMQAQMQQPQQPAPEME